jgi:hypothetical protein
MCDARNVYERNGGWWYDDEDGVGRGPFDEPNLACEDALNYNAGVEERSWEDFSTGEYLALEPDDADEPFYQDEVADAVGQGE